MTNRPQFLRSSTPGAMPAAGVRAPGEMWLTFPDLQIGLIDTSRNAQKLLAVRYFSASANYVVGDFVIQAGVLYAAKASITAGAFNATQWTKVAAATDAGGPYLPIAGGTLTGALVLAADPGAALGAATKQYVDGKVSAAPFLPIAGGTLTGPVILSGPPTIPLHAATKAYVDAGAFVPIGGGTMTGDLILNRDAQVALGAATKSQVDARGAGDNRIINGDMRIDQRNAGAAGTALGYTVDRWQVTGNIAGKLSWGRNFGPPGVFAPGFPYCLGAAAGSTFTLAATDFFVMMQSIEADMVSDFAWGTPQAQSVTLSFWALSYPLTGTFSGSIRNVASTRSYPFTFSLPANNAWTKVSITVPGDTAGTWVMSGNAGSIHVMFDLGVGSTYRGPANAWASTNYMGATGAQSMVATNNSSFFVTGVKLEIGSVATPFNRQSLAKSMADCQRYFWRTLTPFTPVGNMGGAGMAVNFHITNPVTMRDVPTVSSTFTGVSNCTTGILNIGIHSFDLTIGSQAAGTMYATWSAGNTISAEF